MARFVVTCTQYNRKYLSGLAQNSTTPIFCVYHGINLDYFSPENDHVSCSPVYRLLTVARMTEKKGLEIVYKALAILRDRGIKFHHTLIGQGDDEEKVVATIKTLDLKKMTELCGALPHEEVIKYYSHSDLFVLGCQIAENGDRDGIPNVMAESMAMGLPVVATHVSGIPEFLENEITGMMVEPKDPMALANAMETLLTNESLRKKVIRTAREKIVKQFNNKKLINDLAGIYIRMIPGLGDSLYHETRPARKSRK